MKLFHKVEEDENVQVLSPQRLLFLFIFQPFPPFGVFLGDFVEDKGTQIEPDDAGSGAPSVTFNEREESQKTDDFHYDKHGNKTDGQVKKGHRASVVAPVFHNWQVLEGLGDKIAGL